MYNNLWEVTGNGISYSSTEANLEITQSLPAGTYDVTLTITDPETGCSGIDAVSVTVHPSPATPVLYFANSAHTCSYYPPVILGDATTINNPSPRFLNWSNGDYGAIASYYSSGYAYAYYVDPATGCRSKDSSIFIIPPPNFDALLTGCYWTCKDKLQSPLGVYGFAANTNDYTWKWYHNNNGLAGGSGTRPMLPLNGNGTYQLGVRYYDCPEILSPPLVLNYDEEPCPCNVRAEVNGGKCGIKDCDIWMDFSIVICNDDESSTFTVSNFWTNSDQTIISWDHNFQVPPNQCRTFYFSILIKDFAATTAEFVISDEINKCKKSFSVRLDWRSCLECYQEFKNPELKFLRDESTLHQASYFDFYGMFPEVPVQVISMWCEPHILTSPPYTSNYDARAILLFSYAALSQMAAEGKQVCIYAMVCIPEKKKLCLVEYCIDARELLEMIHRDPPGRSEDDPDDDADPSEDDSRAIPADGGKPYLAPNPTRDQVMVMGIDAAMITHITVLTMNLKQAAIYENTNQFGVTDLAQGIYIVRVITKDHQAKYLKLIKQ